MRAEFIVVNSLAPDTAAAHLVALVASSPDGIISFKPDGTILTWNPGAERIFGYSSSEAVGQHVDLIVPEDRVAEPADFFSRVRQGEPLAFETVRRRKDGTLVDVAVTLAPIRLHDGTIAGVSAIARNITERRRADAALRDAERRLTAVLNNASVSIFLMDDRQQCIYMNAAAEMLTGYTLREVLELDRPLHDIVHHTRPDGSHFPLSECAIDRAFPENNNMRGEEVFVHKDGTFYPVAFTASPVRDEASQTIGTIIEVRDTREEKAAAQALHESRERLLLAQRAARAVTWEWDFTKNVVRWNDLSMVRDLAGADLAEETRFETWAARIHPADIDQHVAQGAAAVAAGHGELVFRIVKDGEIRWLEAKGQVTDWGPDGSALKMVGITLDITERKRAEEHQKLLINELNHRVKNSLAIVQGLAQQTFRGEAAAQSAREAFEGRLQALSAAHNILTEQNWEAALLESVVAATLAPFAGCSSRIACGGPSLRLPPKMAVSFALALHELATNAVKHGALSGAEGKVDVRWRADAGRLSLVWHERDGPPVKPPTSRGFGTRMIERGLSAELAGDVSIQFNPEGILCSIQAPLPVIEG